MTETTQGYFRILLWGPGAVPDMNLVRTAYKTFEDAEGVAKRAVKTTAPDYSYGYSIVVEVEDFRKRADEEIA